MLLNYGVLYKVKAIILGIYDQFNDYGYGKQPIDILKLVLAANNISKPLVYNIECEHIHPSNALQINAKTIIDFDKEEIYQLF